MTCGYYAMEYLQLKKATQVHFLYTVYTVNQFLCCLACFPIRVRLLIYVLFSICTFFYKYIVAMMINMIVCDSSSLSAIATQSSGNAN